MVNTEHFIDRQIQILLYFQTFENSIGMAVDTGIADIVILGDFNLNVLNAQSAREITEYVTNIIYHD